MANKYLIVLQVPDDAGQLGVSPDGHSDVGNGGQKLRPVSPTLREEDGFKAVCELQILETFFNPDSDHARPFRWH